MRRPGRVRNRVVDVAHLSRCVAAREPARQIAAAHEPRQRRRGPISRLADRWRKGHLLELGGGGHLAQHRCGYRPEAGHVSGRLRAALNRRLFGDDLDHYLPQRLLERSGRALVAAAATFQAGLAGGHRAHGVGATLLCRAGIIAAYRAGDFIQARIECGALRDREFGPNPRHARANRADVDVPVIARRARFAHSGGVELFDPHVDALGQLGPRHLRPCRRPFRKRLIKFGQQIRLGNVLAAIDQRRHHPEVHRPGCEHLSHLGQPLP